MPNHNFPDTFEKITQDQGQFVAQFRSGGGHVRHIKIDIDKFADFLRKDGANATLFTLNRFAGEVAREEDNTATKIADGATAEAANNSTKIPD